MRAVHDGILKEERERLGGEDALLLDGDASNDPGLRRLRLAKAQLAEWELEVKRGELVPADTAMQALAIVGARLRRLGEGLERRYGREVGDAIAQALTEAESDLERDLGSGGGKS